MKKILVIVLSSIRNDARVLRQLDFLKKTYAVTIVCFDAVDTTEYSILKIKKTNLTLARKLASAFFFIDSLLLDGLSLIE